MKKADLDLYTDYLLSTFGAVTATGLSAMVEGEVSHDKITRFLSEQDYTSKDLWKQVKSTVRRVEYDEGVLIFDDTIQEKAKAVEELRAAQAIALPLMLGLSLEQTAMVIGRSVGATCTMRVRFVRMLSGEQKATRSKREAQILDEVLSEAKTGGVVIVPPLKPAIEARLGKALALSTVYQMLARHGWRKLVPDKVIPKPTRPCVTIGKKLPERLAEEVAAFAISRPLRLMFQDEARFGRISDVRHCWDKKPHRPMVRAMVTQQ